MRRKLFAAAVSMLTGIVFAYYADAGWHWYAVCALFMAAAWRIFCKLEQRREAAAFFAAFLLGAFLLAFVRYQGETSQLAAYEGKEKALCGTVTEVQKLEEDKYRICCMAEGEKLLCSYYAPLQDYWQLLGCKIAFRTTIEKAADAGNPRTFDYRLYLKTRGIWYTATMEKFQILDTHKSLLRRIQVYIIGCRENMFSEMALPGDVQGLVRGAVFGDVKSLSEETYEAFRQNGTAHVLSVSGLHVGMLYGAYRKLTGKRKSLPGSVFLIGLLLLYGTVTLWSVPVSRAVLLILFLYFADISDRRYDMVTALAAVVMLTAAKNPYVIFGASFQMSFLAMLSMAFFTPPLEKRLGTGAASVLSVQLGLLPYMAYTFNYVSLIGIICNIPVVFLVSLLVPLGVAGYLLYFAAGVVLPFYSRIMGGLSWLTVKINALFQADGILSFDVISPPLPALLLVYGAAFFCSSEHFFIYFGRRRLLPVAAPVLLIFAVVLAGWAVEKSPFDKADMVFLDVGQGDCLHVRYPDGNLLIDGGGNIRYNVGEKTLKPYLLRNGVSHLELAAATHLHTDHFLGLAQLKAVFPVQHMLLEGEAGQRVRLGKAHWIDILWPESRNPDTEDENLNSLIFKVHAEGTTVLVTGDITEEGERLLLEKYKGTKVLQADILKVAHHGSPYSSCDAFLEAVAPEAAVISVGKNNYGHPDEKLIEKMQNYGIMVYRTDRSGAVGIICEGGGFSVCTKRT